MFAVERQEHFQQVPGNQLTCLGGHKLGAPSHLLGRGLPDGRRPVGLLTFEDPEGTFGQMTSDRAHSNGMPLAL